MKFSKALVESLEGAQYFAGHFEGKFLESWHLLIAIGNNPYSVAGGALAEFPMVVDNLEDVAFEVTGQEFKEKMDFEDCPHSKRLATLLADAGEVAEVLHAKEVGTEHVLCAILMDRGNTAIRILEEAGMEMETEEGEERERENKRKDRVLVVLVVSG